MNYEEKYRQITREILTKYVIGGVLNTSYCESIDHLPNDILAVYREFGQLLTFPANTPLHTIAEQQAQLNRLEEIREIFKNHFNRSE